MEIVGDLLRLLLVVVVWLGAAFALLLVAGILVLLAAPLVSWWQARLEARVGPGLAHRLRLCKKARLGYRCSGCSRGSG